MNKIKGYTCSCCGKYHDELPTSYGTLAPVYYEFATPAEREKRFELSEDLCVMDNEHFFIRGCVEIPIIGANVLVDCHDARARSNDCSSFCCTHNPLAPVLRQADFFAHPIKLCIRSN
jgi:hypothetical protein